MTPEVFAKFLYDRHLYLYLVVVCGRCCPHGAKRRAIADNPLARWDRLSIRNRAVVQRQCVIPFQIFSVSWA